MKDFAGNTIPDLITWTDAAGRSHALNADLVATGVDERTAEVTEHPIEDGSAVSDHVVQLPGTLTLELVQTQTPISDANESRMQSVSEELEFRQSQFSPGGLFALSQAVVGLVNAGIGALFGGPEPLRVKVLQVPGGANIDRVNEFHDELIRLQQDATPIKVTLAGREYPDVLITKITKTLAKGSARFAIDVKTFRTVTTATASLPDPETTRNNPKKTRGNKSAKDADDPSKSRKSLLKMLVG